MRSSGIVAIAAALGIAGAAGAQSVDQRHANQQARIQHGVDHGTLTPGEANHLEHQQHSIHREETNMRAANGGRLTHGDRRVLRHRENRASHHIYNKKHNARVD